MNKDEIIAMARDANPEHDLTTMLPFLSRFAALVAAKEREECAQVCESRVTPGTGSVAILGGAADAIRAKEKP